MTRDDIMLLVDPNGELAKHAGPGWVKEIVDRLWKAIKTNAND